MAALRIYDLPMSDLVSSTTIDASIPRRCISCGYDLYGVTGDRCPECGHVSEPGLIALIGHPSPKGVLRFANTHPVWTAIGLLLIGLGGYLLGSRSILFAGTTGDSDLLWIATFGLGALLCLGLGQVVLSVRLGRRKWLLGTDGFRTSRMSWSIGWEEFDGFEVLPAPRGEVRIRLVPGEQYAFRLVNRVASGMPPQPRSLEMYIELPAGSWTALRLEIERRIGNAARHGTT